MTDFKKKYVLSEKPTEPKLSDEAILQHKNFKKLKANYQKATQPHYTRKPLHKNKFLFLALLLILLIVYLLSK